MKTLCIKFAFFGLLVICIFNSCSGDTICEPLSRQTVSRAEGQLIEPALTVLKNNDRRYPDICIRNAIQALGNFKSEKYIPVFLTWLDWEDKNLDHYKMHARAERYPAEAALFQVGPSAIPYLVEFIAKRQFD